MCFLPVKVFQPKHPPQGLASALIFDPDNVLYRMARYPDPVFERISTGINIPNRQGIALNIICRFHSKYPRY